MDSVNKFADFENFTKFYKINIYKPNLSGMMQSATKNLGPITDQFSRFDVYWIQTDRQANYI